MDTQNTPAAIGNEALAVLQTAGEVLQRNQISLSKANEAGNQIVQYINANGMSDALDEKCNLYLVNVNKTIKAMNERRSPITQMMTQIAKQFTSLEADLKDGSLVKTIQLSRNEWAKKKEDDRRAKEEAARRKLAADNERVEVKRKVELDLIAFTTGQISLTVELIMRQFNEATLETIDDVVVKIKSYPTDYDKVHKYSAFAPQIKAIYLTPEEVQAVVESVKAEKYDSVKKEYWAQIDDLIINLEAKAPARKKELEQIAVLEKQNAEAAQKLKEEADQRAKDEAAKAKQEADEKAKQATATVQASAEAAKMNNLFAATESAVVADTTKAQVRKALKITVTHQAGWVELFTFYMQTEGIGATLEELEKKTFKQIKAFAEKYATKTGEVIESKYLRYEDDFTAVNKA